jgi:hypothetical protein
MIRRTCSQKDGGFYTIFFFHAGFILRSCWLHPPIILASCSLILPHLP